MKHADDHFVMKILAINDVKLLIDALKKCSIIHHLITISHRDAPKHTNTYLQMYCEVTTLL